MPYSIYKAVNPSKGFEVSSNRFCLIADDKISRYQNIEISTGETVILAVSEDRWYKPVDESSYDLGPGLKALATMTIEREKDPLDEIRNSIAQQVMYDDVHGAQEEIADQGYKLGAAFN